MVALTSKEILTELEKLGIKTPSELKSYLREYAAYYTLQYRYNDYNDLSREETVSEECKRVRDLR